MSKIVCPNCNNDKIVFVNELIEKPEKEGAVFFSLLRAVCFLVILISFIFFVRGEELEKIPALYVLIGSCLFLILTYIFRLLQPFRYENKTKCICLDCGDTWYLDDKKQSTSTNSNP
ncbi:MAG: hypothetical protein IJW43_05890 [Clostridia bacterium]|nr:hypothetical protein [Clostridia bacterium]